MPDYLALGPPAGALACLGALLPRLLLLGHFAQQGEDAKPLYDLVCHITSLADCPDQVGQLCLLLDDVVLALHQQLEQLV